MYRSSYPTNYKIIPARKLAGCRLYLERGIVLFKDVVDGLIRMLQRMVYFLAVHPADLFDIFVQRRAHARVVSDIHDEPTRLFQEGVLVHGIRVPGRADF